MVEGSQNFPVQWIEQEFIRRKQERKHYSLRQFAKKLGVPPGRLSEILSKKRRITPAIGEKWADKLEFSPQEKNAFLRSVYLRDLPPENLTSFPEQTELKEEVFHLISDWYHFAILSLINTDRFNPSPINMSKRLGISVVEMRNALQRLEKLKLIKREKETWVRTQEHLTTTWDIPSAALRKSHRQELERAIEGLEIIPTELRDVSAFTMAVNPTRLPEAKKLIREFQRKMEKILETGKRTEVYTLNIQLMPVTKGVTK
jgi:uncharacterized protein (TIGR02147 family)